MPSFQDSFWTGDYAAGLGVLFSKLQQGVIENRQVLTIARMRAEAEEAYGQKLSEIAPAADKIQGGFARDDGASVRKAFDGVRTEMVDGAKNHKKIAQNIRDLVVNPFSRWCEAHETRIQDSQDELQTRIKAHDRQAEQVKKLRSNYFNKCRLVEDLEEENKFAFQDPQDSPKPNIPEIKVSDNKEADVSDEDEVFEIGDEHFDAEEMKKRLAHMLNNIKLQDTKVPILGTYMNTSAGADIVEYLQKYMDTTSVSYAERIGQDLVSAGFLRLVGNVGNTFANSSKLFYQWRPKAFQLSGVPEKKPAVGRTFSMASNGPDNADSPVVGTLNEYLANWNPLNNPYPNETPADRLRREQREADDKYKTGVRKLDETRCELEEAISVHLKFLERCELDRLKAIKTVILDFSGAIGNVLPIIQSAVDKMMLYQETIQPQGDLRYLLENYRTGRFAPRVTIYENYYNKVDEQTFGVDLEARARADKKRVPMILTTILTYLDNHYPDLEGDDARRGVWLVDVPLSQTHALRAKVNDGKPFSTEVFSEFDIPTVASLLKLYLLELPDSLVSSHVYEIIRNLYNNPGPETSEDGNRVGVLQQTLSQLRLTNIATLDACMNHFTRLIELTSADEEYVSSLATALAPCIMRPRVETSLTMEEKHAYRLIRDLFAHKTAIFSELKRMSTQGLSASISTKESQRPRSISTNESNRRQYQEERQRLLLEKAGGSRSRVTSPAPSPRGPGSSHRRDRSVGRFPVSAPGVTSPTEKAPAARQSVGPVLGIKRSSLEVPGEAGTPTQSVSSESLANGSETTESPASTRSRSETIKSTESVEKRNSLGRNPARSSLGRRIPVNPTPLAESATDEHRGVTLEDKPMDD
ncbi:hypothetical protein M406DRAFT_285725 [Cryphonectria parasitica EP155]|uniref:Rho-GTPase-activating protein 8 n=1 Tax=Cryphonectria parasitica (strain ATCC 38755 / EP155) TaxID=660469 RepID=A0A9P5CV79_CRYP1|nr:uncharacterized protein M406DRAFT_285725 [Cryphonectria parasitica EP155]KAF3770916.1 hypothetical protein M406DRAFT_285725 [Cryphonectria parasitica EP155]